MRHRCFHTALLLAGLTLVLSSQSLPAQTNGPLSVHPENPRYFADSSGEAILLAGSHTWPNLVDMGPSDPPPAFDFDAYLRWLKGYGHNFTRGWTWEPTKWDNTRITTQDPPSDLIPPYPPSDFIESLTVDAHRVSIGDGDNWANTWGDDDRLYSFFTDGKGFDRKKRVSCAPVIIKGHPPQISGRDLVSPTGTIPDPSGKNSRKVCGLLMVDGVLFAWVRNLNLPDAPKGTGAGMMASTDRGRTWEWVDWNWPELGYPV